MINIPFKKITIIITVVIVIAVTGYVTWRIYDNIAQSRIDAEIREAGLSPDDYDLEGVAPWNVREAVTDQEIEKAGLNPDDYAIEGELTADEVRMEVIRQEISKQLAQYDLTIDDIDLSGIDLLTMTTQEINDLVYKKAYQKVLERSAQ
jgi:hypothetical protein